jgi:hypothetical protein
MPFDTIYNDLIDTIITQLKTITELSDTGGVKVFKWKTGITAIQGRTEAVVMAGPMEPLNGFTTKSSNNEFQVIIDLLHYSSNYQSGFNSAMAVAQKIYDKFHLTNINNLVRIAKVSLFPGDGQLSQRNLLAIPIRVVVRCEKTITQ